MIIVSPSFRWFWGPPTQNHRVPCYRCWLVAYPAATDSPVLFSFSLFSSCFSIRLTESCCWRVVRHELHIAAEKYICVCVCMYLCNIYIYMCLYVCVPIFRIQKWLSWTHAMNDPIEAIADRSSLFYSCASTASPLTRKTADLDESLHDDVTIYHILS